MEEEELNRFEKIMAEIRNTEQLNDYINNYCVPYGRRFHEMLNDTIIRNDLKVADVMRASGININYGYNIVNGARKNPGRDKIIALCIGSGMNFRETQAALDAAGLARLYYRSERDVRIAAALNNKVCDVFQVNMDLSEHDLEPLAV